MDNKYVGYNKYISMKGSCDVRAMIESKIREEGEEKKKKIMYDPYASDRYNNKRSKIFVAGMVITIICIVIAIVIITKKNGILGTGNVIYVGSFIVAVAFFVLPVVGGSYTAKVEKSDSLKKKIKAKEIDDETNNRIKSEIMQYNINVKETYQKIISNPSNIEPLVDYSVGMFNRMISHADSGSSKKFIESIFMFEVTTKGVKYIYESSYSNPRDDFNFAINRFRNLHYDYECEGLALALAKAISNKIKMIYPPNTFNIEVRNKDAIVMMVFKAANENFVVARDLF